jgi:hypothetical protein
MIQQPHWQRGLPARVTRSPPTAALEKSGRCELGRCQCCQPEWASGGLGPSVPSGRAALRAAAGPEGGSAQRRTRRADAGHIQ